LVIGIRFHGFGIVRDPFIKRGGREGLGKTVKVMPKYGTPRIQDTFLHTTHKFSQITIDKGLDFMVVFMDN